MSVLRSIPRSAAKAAVSVAEDSSGGVWIGTYGGGSSLFNDGGPGIYGFNWWFNAPVASAGGRLTWPDAPSDTFMSVGAGGYCSVMIPSEKLVLAAYASEQDSCSGPRWCTVRRAWLRWLH